MKKTLLGLLALVALFGLALGPACAQNGGWHNGPGGHRHHGGIHWSGIVDDRVVVFIQGSQVTSHVRSGNPIQHESYQVREPLPQAPVQVYLSEVNGRGHVTLFQQPNPGNNFTAGVRIHDPQGGAGRYSFTLSWH